MLNKKLNTLLIAIIFVFFVSSIGIANYDFVEDFKNISLDELLEILKIDIVKFSLPKDKISRIILWIDIYEKDNIEPIKTIGLSSIFSKESVNGDFLFSIGFDEPPLFKKNEIFIAWGVKEVSKGFLGTRTTLDISKYINIHGRKTKAFRKPDKINIRFNEPIAIYQFLWGEKIYDCNLDDITNLVKHHDFILTVNIMFLDEKYEDYDPITRTFK
ncbi:hypothetical protein BBF96_12820 [Anoxybacter fermentans]|uniref:Uncharacterized protein n=1 Tax=Anoxybacter fermentans TaxID=1323375 RepID=A0A3S9T0T4_9FIRM|nr:hypothetical protein [Anoxybacter fermentans]AZR74203.1 hypothetical protein BBF96_12820 [Anoxybacter fermentans]